MASLLFITQYYPLNYGDTAFIQHEIPYTAREFDRVRVLCVHGRDTRYGIIETPENVTVEFVEPERGLWRKTAALFSPRFYRMLFGELLTARRTGKRLSVALLRATAGFLSSALRFEKVLRRALSCYPDISVIYSYWYHRDTMAALLLKERLKTHTDTIFVSVCSRAHRYDLYEFRSSLAYQPFKRWMDKRIDAVFFISRHGLDYYIKTFAASNRNKYYLAYLGITNKYWTRSETEVSEQLYSIDKGRPGGAFTIVSCSYIVPVKRIDLIIQALSMTGETGPRIHWIHIGNGVEYTRVTNMAKEILSDSETVSCEFMGFMPNDAVMEFYHHNYIDCFVSASESEGLPVSMMEAISFGIPVIATNVGGVPEIVNEKTGVLLPADVSADGLAKAIGDFCSWEEGRRTEMRRSARLLWEERFNAAKNHAEFSKILRLIAEKRGERRHTTASTTTLVAGMKDE